MSLHYLSAKRRVGRLIVVLACSLMAATASAQAPNGGDAILVANAHAKVTRAEYDAELLRLPPEIRPGFANNAKRITELLQRMLLQKSLAAQAKSAGVDKSSLNALRLQLEVDRFLAQLYVEDIEAKAAAQFDADRERYEARARELYIVDRAKYEVPESITVTHILFDTKARDTAAAKSLATDTRAKIAAGADMGKLASELSDDPSAKANSGKIDWFVRKEMDPAFADAAFALKSPGDLSGPVMSKFGWHVIRLDGRNPASVPPYEQVREAILADIKKRYVDERRDQAIAAIRADPTQYNREAVDALINRVDVNSAVRALTNPAAPAK